MTIRTSRWLWLAAALSLTLLLIASPAQAKHKDDGDVIHCKDLASCLALIPAPGGDADLSGSDASNLGSVGDDDVPDPPPVDLPPVDSAPTFPAPAAPQAPAPATPPEASPAPTAPEAPPAPPVQAPSAPTNAGQPATAATTQTTTTTVTPPAAPAQPAPSTTTTTVLQVVTTSAPKTPAAATTTTVAAPPPPPPVCSNHPEFGQTRPQGQVKNPDGTCSYDACLNQPDIQPITPAGWRQNADGSCEEIPKLDLELSGPASVNAPAGNAKFTITIANNGSTLASAVLYKQYLDANGNLTLVDIQGQGDLYGKSDNMMYYKSVGTIQPGRSAQLTISLKAAGAGTITVGVVEPGGEADTNTANNHLSITITPTVLQTLLSVKQHGLKWGGHYYRDTQVFARVLAREGSTWRGWKKNHPALAAGLIAHNAVARQKK
jgi:hypothetical protein